MDLHNGQVADRERRIAGGSGRPARVPILMYHEIAARPASARHLAVTPGDFAAQLAYLRDGGYTTLTAADLVQGEAGRIVQWPAKPVVLTFDDGFADFHDAALPLLRRYGFTATLFVTTGWIANGAGTAARSRPPRMLSWSQLAEVAAAGVEVGAHSHHHAMLDQLTGNSLRQELEVSKAILEDRLGLPVTGLAYPFGYSNARVREAASAAGYRYGCAVGNRTVGHGADRFALPRLTIGRMTTMRNFGQVAAGDRLPPEFLAYRTMTSGWSAVRRVRSAVGWITQ
jgi:peptidoglycan/xylan/chitin deacetylase (PgdA/CDA1 family)